ncbi:MAG: hypothetical protein M3470_01265 [Chloroflexota bacterium]|nr:hypothetical protein [Chloroflexota bacterium]
MARALHRASAVPKKIIGKVASVVSDALRDADVARRSAHDPQFHRDVQKDRRGTLSRYKTVQHALRDRAASEKASKRGKGGRASPGRPAGPSRAAGVGAPVRRSRDTVGPGPATKKTAKKPR